MKEKILISGATGFLGSYVVKRLLRDNFEIAIIKRSSSDLWRLEEVQDKLTLFSIEELTIGEIIRNFKPNIVVHTACDYGRQNSSLSQVIKTNLVLGIELLEQCIINNVQLFVNTDTFLPKDVNSYSLSKNQFTEWLNKERGKVQVINMKIEYMYGPGHGNNSFTSWLIDQMIDNTVSEIPLTSGKQMRDIVYVEDVAYAYLLVIKKKEDIPPYFTFHVGTNKLVTIKSFVMTIANYVESCTGIEVHNRLNFGKVPYRDGDIMEPELDNQDLVGLGWYPNINISQGINQTVESHLIKRGVSFF